MRTGGARPSPPPSKAATRLKKYLDMIDSVGGIAKWMDFFRIAGNQRNTNNVINRLTEWGFIKEIKKKRYKKTETGQITHNLLTNHQDIIGILTQDLTGTKFGHWPFR